MSNLKNLYQVPHLQVAGGSTFCGLLVVIGKGYTSLVHWRIPECEQKASSHTLEVCKPTHAPFHVLDLAIDASSVGVGPVRSVGVQDVFLYILDASRRCGNLFGPTVLCLAYPVIKESFHLLLAEKVCVCPLVEDLKHEVCSAQFTMVIVISYKCAGYFFKGCVSLGCCSRIEYLLVLPGSGFGCQDKLCAVSYKQLPDGLSTPGLPTSILSSASNSRDIVSRGFYPASSLLTVSLHPHTGLLFWGAGCQPAAADCARCHRINRRTRACGFLYPLFFDVVVLSVSLTSW